MLSQQTILITRPAGREKHLRQLIEDAGATVVHYPVMTILPPSASDIKQLLSLPDTLHPFTMAIFISPTAVEQSLIYFPVLPDHFIIAAIGSRTSLSLQQHNIDVDIEAVNHNTESLLNDPQFQTANIKGLHILIFRGNGGRALLGDTLISRGAQVRYVETYQRQLSQQAPLTSPQLARLTAITVSSNQGLDNLVTLMHGSAPLINIPLIVPSQRAHALATHHGFKSIIVANNATDESILLALKRYFTR